MGVFPVTLSDRKPNQYTACKKKKLLERCRPFFIERFIFIFVNFPLSFVLFAH